VTHAVLLLLLLLLVLLPGVLEDEHYEHGDDGQDTYEHLGPILVRGSAVSITGS
jgi:hypothetical protein